MAVDVQPRFLILSGHDYRSKRKVNTHFIADGLKLYGHVRFFSLGFSWLSNVRGRDPRIGMSCVNKVEEFATVECYLWRASFHPFNTRSMVPDFVSKIPFDIYTKLAPNILVEWIKNSDVILIETGLSILFIDLIKKTNPQCKLVYIASDDLETIKASPILSKRLKDSGSLIDLAAVPSKHLLPKMPQGVKSIVTPHGIDQNIVQLGDPSPYGAGLNAISVGSMLFDPDFFHMAVDAFPDVTFHIIGSGCARNRLPSHIEYYQEMAFADTIRYIKHANFGVAPYSESDAPIYLSDTSMKLMQYQLFQIPAVCPVFAVGDHSNARFGYIPGDKQSIHHAIQGALNCPGVDRLMPWTWNDVTNALVEALTN